MKKIVIVLVLYVSYPLQEYCFITEGEKINLATLCVYVFILFLTCELKDTFSILQ